MEEEYSYETISKVRIKRISNATFETRKENKRREIDSQIRDFERSRRQGFLGRVFASKTEEEKQRDEEEIDKFTRDKEKEFEKFTKDSESQLQSGSILDLDNIPLDMADDYFQFKVSIDLKEIGIRLYGYQENPRQRICTIKTGGLSAIAKIGPVTQLITLKLGYLEVQDEIDPFSRYKYLTHTVMDKGEDKGHFIFLILDSNSRRKQGAIRITFETRAKQYIVTNFVLIDALQKFFTAESVDVSYYAKLASNKISEFLDRGAEYIETVQVESEYKGIDARIRIQTPILVIPENISEKDEDKEAVILNLGMFKGSSNCQVFDKRIDYTKVREEEKLYDKYKLEFEGLRLTMVKDLDSYEQWYKCPEKIDIIEDILLTLKAKR